MCGALSQQRLNPEFELAHSHTTKLTGWLALLTAIAPIRFACEYSDNKVMLPLLLAARVVISSKKIP